MRGVSLRGGGDADDPGAQTGRPKVLLCIGEVIAEVLRLAQAVRDSTFDRRHRPLHLAQAAIPVSGGLRADRRANGGARLRINAPRASQARIDFLCFFSADSRHR
jgi:hypothetical protein